LRTKDPIPLCITDQFNDPDALQPFDCALRGCEGDSQLVSCKFGSDERMNYVLAERGDLY